MSLQIDVGGTLLPKTRYENPVEMSYLTFGVQQRMADTTLRSQYLGAKWQMRIFWHGLLQAERDTLFTVYVDGLLTPKVWTMNDGKVLTALTTLGSWRESFWMQPRTNILFFDVEFTIEHV